MLKRHHVLQVEGITGLLDAYKRSLEHLELWGPTYFSPFLDKAKGIASEAWPDDEQVYHVLLVLTDGAITDMDLTKDRCDT